MALNSRTVRTFLLALGVTLAVLAGLAALLAGKLRWNFILMWAALLVAIGGAYVFFAIFAWTGFANVYRVSPTLFFGLPSYRQVVLRGVVLKEGRDADALAVGLAFGGSLVAIGAALYEPIFAAVDLAGLALVLAFLLVVRVTGTRARS